MRYIVGRKRAEEALGFLAAVSGAIETAPAVEAAVPRIVDLAVPYLADWCAVHRPSPDGPAGCLARAVRAGTDPFRILALDRCLGPRASGESSGPEDGSPAGLGVVVALSLAIVFRGRRLGILTLARLEREGATPYRSAELALAGELARRLGGVLEIVRLDETIERNLVR